MESISLKLEDEMLKEIDSKLIDHRFSTRTEFIRDAIREKLSELERVDILRNITKLKGSSKIKTSELNFQKAKEQAFKDLEKKFNL